MLCISTLARPEAPVAATGEQGSMLSFYCPLCGLNLPCTILSCTIAFRAAWNLGFATTLTAYCVLGGVQVGKLHVLLSQLHSAASRTGILSAASLDTVMLLMFTLHIFHFNFALLTLSTL